MSNDKNNDVLDQNSLTNLTCLKNEFIKSSKFMDELNLADMQQVEYFFDLLNYFNLTMKIQTEKENFCVLSNYVLQKANSAVSYSKNNGCYQTTMLLDFYFDLPNCVLNQIISCFVQLPYVCQISNSSLICQDGCVSFYLNYDPAKSKFLKDLN